MFEITWIEQASRITESMGVFSFKLEGNGLRMVSESKIGKALVYYVE
ncbi:MAG: hypothetical protein WCJ35_12610 [Planctomycetota bacterium]